MKIPYLLTTTVTVLSLSTALLVPPFVQAQNNVVLFGSGQGNTLAYKLRNKRPGARQNVYSFFAKLPNKAVAELQVIYPQNFRGVFRSDNVTVMSRRSQKKFEIRETIIDREVNSIRFVFQEPIAALPNQEVEILVQDVVNPETTGMYRIEAQALGTEANPLFQYLGQWLVSIY